MYFEFCGEIFSNFYVYDICKWLTTNKFRFLYFNWKSKAWNLTSLTRQVMFLIPLILIFPLFFGINGVMYAGPIADLAAAVVAISFAVRELKKMKNENKNCLSV